MLVKPYRIEMPVYAYLIVTEWFYYGVPFACPLWERCIWAFYVLNLTRKPSTVASRFDGYIGVLVNEYQEGFQFIENLSSGWEGAPI